VTAESDLNRAILSYLQAVGVFAWRCNSGALKNADGVWVKYGRKGMADILGILPGGKFLAIEAKVGRAKPTKEQHHFLGEIRRSGGVAILAHTLDDVLRELEGAL